MAKFFQKPLLHCLLIGAVIVLVQWQTQPPPEVYIDQAEIQRLKDEIEKAFGSNQPIDENKLVEQLAEDEILYLEAKAASFDKLDTVVLRLANVADFLQLVPKDSSMDERYQAALSMKLDETDIVVRRQMVTLYKTALKNSGAVPEPSEQAIEQYSQDHQQTYTQAARYAFSHVYLQSNGADAAADLAAAGRLRAKLLADGNNPASGGKDALDKAIEKGDVFYGGHHFNLQSQRQIARHFGQQFAQALPGLAQQQWSPPVTSGFGYHLVWISDSSAATPKPLAQVRSNIVREITMQAEEQLFQQKLQGIISKYRILVAGDNDEYTAFTFSEHASLRADTDGGEE